MNSHSKTGVKEGEMKRNRQRRRGALDYLSSLGPSTIGKALIGRLGWEGKEQTSQRNVWYARSKETVVLGEMLNVIGAVHISQRNSKSLRYLWPPCERKKNFFSSTQKTKFTGKVHKWYDSWKSIKKYIRWKIFPYSIDLFHEFVQIKNA